MSGFGGDGMGDGPMGEGAQAEPSLPRVAEYPRAVLFDGATRGAVLQSDGFYQPVHPVDQRVELALLVQAGKVAAHPELGSELRSIEHLDSSVGGRATAVIQNKLARLVANGDIRVDRIDVETTAFGGLAAAVHYVNLRLPGSNQRTARLTT